MIRRIILEQSHRAHVGHIGSCLSVVDILAVLYSDILKASDPSDQDRDRFILSKGHSALAHYAALHLKGLVSAEQLNSFCTNGSYFGVHSDHRIAGVDFSTGSLGQGFPFGVGAALAARLQNSSRRIYVLLSDAECNEGSVWEAAMVAAHHRFANLTVIVDVNGQQAFGYTRDIVDLSPIGARWAAFDWDVRNVDGHDSAALKEALSRSSTKPVAVIAKTVFGKGVSFMESQIKWHYFPMSDLEYQRAVSEVDAQ